MKIIIFTVAVNHEKITFTEYVHEGDFIKQKDKYVCENETIYKNKISIFTNGESIFNQFACTEQEANFLKDNPKLFEHLKHDMLRELREYINNKIIYFNELTNLITYGNISDI